MNFGYRAILLTSSLDNRRNHAQLRRRALTPLTMGMTIEMAVVSLLLVRDPLLESIKETSRACQRLLI